jgi:hypothetical protein
MKAPGHLLNLIFNYYRENPNELNDLLPLRRCQISRWWGTLKIVCPDEETVIDILQAQSLLSKPLALLKISKRVRLFLYGSVVDEFAVLPESQRIWEEDFNFFNNYHQD